MTHDDDVCHSFRSRRMLLDCVDSFVLLPLHWSTTHSSLTLLQASCWLLLSRSAATQRASHRAQMRRIARPRNLQRASSRPANASAARRPNTSSGTTSPQRLGVADCESALCLSHACRAISLGESDIAALPVGDDIMFDDADASPVHVNCARFVAPFDRTVRAQLSRSTPRSAAQRQPARAATLCVANW
jgi:hypothetical protein